MRPVCTAIAETDAVARLDDFDEVWR